MVSFSIGLCVLKKKTQQNIMEEPNQSCGGKKKVSFVTRHFLAFLGFYPALLCPDQ
jgi:hypothetical protein